MKPAVTALYLATFAAAVAAGVLWPDGLAQVDEGKRAGDDRMGKTVRPAPAGHRTVEDLLDLAAHAPGFHDEKAVKERAVQALKDWNPEELRRALEESLRDPNSLIYGSVEAKATGALMTALMSRDMDAFKDWFGAIRSEMAGHIMARLAAEACPVDRAEEWLAYSMQHPEAFLSFGRLQSNGVSGKALQAAALRGPAEMEALITVLGKAGVDFHTSDQEENFDLGRNMEFPPGFDFSALAKMPGGSRFWKGHLPAFVLGWLRQNPDEAFATMAAYDPFPGREPYFAFVPRSRPAPLPDGDLVAVLGNKIGTLDEIRRKAAIDQEADLLTADPKIYDRFTQALPDGASQRQAHEFAVRAVNTMGIEAVMPHLEALGTPEERVAFLEGMEVSGQLVGAHSGMTNGEEADLRGRLAEWRATPEQIEAIVNKIEKARP